MPLPFPSLHTRLLTFLSARLRHSTRTKMSTPSTARREQPPWTRPQSHDAALPPLRIYNSLTKDKNQFIPIDPSGKKVTWYCCGPTVYDAGHLGHARNYVTTDVLRRILTDYFGFEVTFVQNVTDVDDKIILRARQEHLLQEFMTQSPSITPEVTSIVSAAWAAYAKNNTQAAADIAPSTFQTWATDVHPQLMDLILKEKQRPTNTEAEDSEDSEITLDERSTKLKMHLSTLHSSASVLLHVPTDRQTFWGATSSILLPYLDSLHQGRSYPPEVFTKLTTYWERHFNDDMSTLNVLPPTIVTRVSEFIPENVAFVEKLVSRGFAYPTADGSVYFDIAAYEAAGHHYAKLQPWNRGDESLIADGEGALTVDATSRLQAGKKTPQDFALWKAFKDEKPGEPSWDSPWGKGRPGWHIECSVMCSEVLGRQVDIHSGGIDLAFPHHDNEIAQSEAYWDGCCDNVPKTADGKHQWVNYFLHMGHLSIHGSKMSKSLKNFVSIRDALDRGGWTPRGLRVVFLMGGWREGIEVREGVLMEAKNWETTVGKFFSNVKALVAEEEAEEKKGNRAPQPFGEVERAIYKELDTARARLHSSLCDNFNTPLAMKTLADLISATNKHLTHTKSLSPVKEVAQWITRIVNIFGLDSPPSSKIGWSDHPSSPSHETTTAADHTQIALPYIRILSTFRDQVRNLAIANPTDPMSRTLLAISDRVRDHDLAPLGVALDDRESGQGKPALVKFVPAMELLAAREEKERKERKREEARVKKEEEDRRKEEAAKVGPAEMYRVGEEGEKWSEWDGEGVPVRDKDGVEVTKSRRKALVKGWERQKKIHEAWVKARGGGGGVA